MSRKIITVSMTEEGYQALVDYMAQEPEKYRTISACVADLCAVGIEAITGQRVSLAGESWGGRRVGSGRKATNEEA